MSSVNIICHQLDLSKYNYTLPSEFQDILYAKNRRYWSKFQVNRTIYLSSGGGVFLLNRDLDYNSPMYSAQQVQAYLQSEGIPTRLIRLD
jgi:hypothetical protein